jgi:uncharacterized OB-fold protein
MNDGATMNETLKPDADYQRFLQEGRFMIQRGRSSGRHHFYPRSIEPGTGNDDLEWVPASGLGTVYSTTVVRTKPPAPSYNVALVDLAEGPRMMSRVEGLAPEEVRIGMAVRARIVNEDGNAFVVFDLA